MKEQETQAVQFRLRIKRAIDLANVVHAVKRLRMMPNDTAPFKKKLAGMSSIEFKQFKWDVIFVTKALEELWSAPVEVVASLEASESPE